MKRLTFPALAAFVLTGCQNSQPLPLAPQAYAGSYTYKSVDTSVDKATDHGFDHLTLSSDGTYDLVQGGSTKARSEKKGVWKVEGGEPPNIVLDHVAYPIQLKQGKIRLLINDDLGEWYIKAG